MQVLPYLGKQFPEAQKGFSQQVAHQLGECLIALPGSTERTAARALGVAASFDDPLFVGEQSLIPPVLRSIADWPVSLKMLTRISRRSSLGTLMPQADVCCSAGSMCIVNMGLKSW